MTGISAQNPFEFSEADTCREFVTPAIQAAGWGKSPFEIAEQRSFTDGRIVLMGRSAKRRDGKRSDYLLRYRRDLTLVVVVVEAKPYIHSKELIRNEAVVPALVNRLMA